MKWSTVFAPTRAFVSDTIRPKSSQRPWGLHVFGIEGQRVRFRDFCDEEQNAVDNSLTILCDLTANKKSSFVYAMTTITVSDIENITVNIEI
jgi:hypothetical protein